MVNNRLAQLLGGMFVLSPLPPPGPSDALGGRGGDEERYWRWGHGASAVPHPVVQQRLDPGTPPVPPNLTALVDGTRDRGVDGSSPVGDYPL